MAIKIEVLNCKPGEHKGIRGPHRVRLAITIDSESANGARDALAEALASKSGKGTFAEALALACGPNSVHTDNWKVW